MEHYKNQVESICSWIRSKDKWTKIHNISGENTPGSCGENTVIGYLPAYNGNDAEATVIYKCHLPIPEDHNVENYQLSALSFSEWVQYMKKIND
ncbi:hypothetical protein [Mangrovibacter plantisponsor]|uniref:Uncharacterized protein n=1 Tax=Mangrovibacter plantisponsor TaxID=451513 RepID=A0A317PH25_9ENTR|nr:hypothetical protein [Mangrovibacter plantisponsor]PWV99581.1 hypothetical protein DES37_12812 [Mangrovibacter plantisponsor]